MNEQQIGQNIRSLRLAAGWTVTALAEAAELSKGAVSKIESGQISSPISTLLRIAAVLQVPLAQLFLEPQADPPYVLTRSGQGQIITRDGTQFGYSYKALALHRRYKGMEPFILTIQPGDPAGCFQHGGEEFIYMLEGRMRFTIGEEALELGPGDSLYFDPLQPHRTEVLGRKPVRFLCVFSAAADRSGLPR